MTRYKLIIFDYDGTLINSGLDSFAANKLIISENKISAAFAFKSKNQNN